MGSVEITSPPAQMHGLDHAGEFRARAPRRRTCLNGKLVYGDGIFAPDGALTLDCAIRDISDGGARIVLSKRQPIPVNLYLIVVKFGVAYHASVVWLNFPARGLKFSQRYDLTAALPDDLKFLHRLWAELGTRSGITDPE
jgi:hypothetical protein